MSETRLQKAIRRTANSRASESTNQYLSDARILLQALRARVAAPYGMEVIAIPCTPYERTVIEAGVKAEGEGNNFSGWVTVTLMEYAKSVSENTEFDVRNIPITKEEVDE